MVQARLARRMLNATVASDRPSGWLPAVLPGGAVEPNARPRCTVDLSCQSPVYGDNSMPTTGQSLFFTVKGPGRHTARRPGPFLFAVSLLHPLERQRIHTELFLARGCCAETSRYARRGTRLSWRPNKQIVSKSTADQRKTCVSSSSVMCLRTRRECRPEEGCQSRQGPRTGRHKRP